MHRTAMIALAAALTALSATAPRAEVEQITAAQQFGVSFLPMMLMERDKLVEKHAHAAGLDKLKVNWTKVAGPSVMNDGLISGTMHFVAQGAPSLITLWARTKGNVGVKGVSAMTTYPLYLNTRNPEVKSIRDFTAKDKIVVPSVKISTQAIMLQMAAAKQWGDAEYARLDPLTVSMSHPDGLVALMNGTGGVNAHFTSSPFHEQEMKMPGTRTVTTNYEILGGPATAVVVTSSMRFRETNPKVYAAFFAGLKEAIDTINSDKRAAAKIYLDMANDKKNTVDDIFAMIGDKDYNYTLMPQKVFATAAFMAKIGTIKEAPASWKDLFFPEVHDLPGD
ncbi:MAG TPA: ABC transporter substrate-binding protein [Alphaproteobacteria bacterium]|nr:ABC transporter substrate-binding protein [Alphaproteobacteria bacterium]